ncbi:MAG TPA: hypothetical protein VLT87_11220 [Thermoanaerobaculia bacterium]|nr:hypothetical protein [Thermoanaerobaculia bacterium]
MTILRQGDPRAVYMPLPIPAAQRPEPEILAIDLGTTRSGWVIYRPEAPFSHRVVNHGHSPNAVVRRQVDAKAGLEEGRGLRSTTLVLEVPQSYNVPASMSLLMTGHWGGVFRAVWGDDSTCELVARPSVKALIAGSANADDAAVKRAVEGRFGGREMAIGDQRCPGCEGKGGVGRGKDRAVCPECSGSKRTPPGPLHGVFKDVWQALALAIAYTEGVKLIDREIWAGADV